MTPNRELMASYSARCGFSSADSPRYLSAPPGTRGVALANSIQVTFLVGSRIIWERPCPEIARTDRKRSDRLTHVNRLITFLGVAAALALAVWLIDGFDFSGEWWEFLIVAAILGLANLIVRPILRLLSLPIVLVTFGLFLIVVNALVLALVVWLSGIWDLGLTSDGFFWDTILASLVISVGGWLIGLVLPDEGRTRALT